MVLFEQRRGQAVVEFALGVMVWMYIAMGIVDFGRAFFVYNVVANTAREGARYATVSSNTSTDIVTYATARSGISGVTVEVLARGTAAAGYSGTPAEVRATATFTPITPLISQICCSGGPLTLQAKSTMYVEL